jgi:CRP/FNR family cyclic AMP-dependent transcriptional regulator
MQTIEDYLPEHPFFAGLDEPTLELLAGCATNVHFKQGEVLFHQGGPAETFYVVRKGRIAIQVHTPAGGGIVLDTADDGGVAGWSWLVPPYRWMFDAVASEATSAVAFDGACVRAKCESDPVIGYALMQRVARVMFDRLEAARVRLIDMYGSAS